MGSKFYWIRHKQGGYLTVADVEDDQDVWSIIGDERMWDRGGIEAEYDILDEIVPPKP